MRKCYKLRIYYTRGSQKGNVKSEELFYTREEMDARYHQLFKRELYGLNPTAWHFNGATWERFTEY